MIFINFLPPQVIVWGLKQSPMCIFLKIYMLALYIADTNDWGGVERSCHSVPEKVELSWMSWGNRWQTCTDHEAVEFRQQLLQLQKFLLHRPIGSSECKL